MCPVAALDGAPEQDWLDAALAGQSCAAVWLGATGLVAPLSYQRHAALAAVCADFAQQGWPVRLRRSGGGVVPQGPGILNVSLAYPCAQAAGQAFDTVYRHLCARLTAALQALGVLCSVGAVQGSFCDGRFNLASQVGGRLCKIAGTAQYWRRAGGQHAVLAHALLLVDADLPLLCEQANRFEAALGSGRRYDPQSLTSVAAVWSALHGGAPPPDDFFARVRQQVLASLVI
ncbi:MAG: lipoyl protein ligase domain-containing protein [Rhodoferax sp.]